MLAYAGTALPQIVVRWAKFYGDHKTVSTGFTYVHLAGVLVGGGLAIAADRTALRLARGPVPSLEVSRDLASLTTVHRWVTAGLLVTLVSGLGMLFADLKTYLPSVVFWTKMGLIVLLIVNGYLRLRAEAALQQGTVAAWKPFRRTSVASLVLWFAILLAGTILTAAA